jgi:hypothetical protein
MYLFSVDLWIHHQTTLASSPRRVRARGFAVSSACSLLSLYKSRCLKGSPFVRSRQSVGTLPLFICVKRWSTGVGRMKRAKKRRVRSSECYLCEGRPVTMRGGKIACRLRDPIRPLARIEPTYQASKNGHRRISLMRFPLPSTQHQITINFRVSSSIFVPRIAT